MCEKCDLKNYKPFLTPTDEGYCVENEVASYLTISYYPNLKRWELSSFEGEIEIHYCPFCGRKLEEEEC